MDENAYSPNVYIFIVFLVVDHLWRQVIKRPANGFPSVGRRVHAPPEVCNLQRAQTIQQILRLYVPMDDILLMHVCQRLAQLQYIIGGPFLSESSFWLLFEFLEEFTAWSVFQDEVDLVFIVEKAMHFEDVFVLQMCLDLDFSPELVLHV